MQTVLLTRLNGAFDINLAEAFAREGYGVYAVRRGASNGGGACSAHAPLNVTALPDDFQKAAETVKYEAGKIDIYVELSDERDAADSFNVRGGIDEKIIRGLYEENVFRPMAALEAFLYLLDAGDGKRLCFITSSDASINESRSINGYGYAMGKAAMSNFYQMISNKLTPSGYTFRVYDPLAGEVGPESAAEGAFKYFTRRRGTENNDPLRDDENRLVFRDAYAREHAW